MLSALSEAKRLIDGIRNYRQLYGMEHPKHNEYWDEINKLYYQMTESEQEEFNDYVD